MNKLKQLFIILLSVVFLNNNIISMEQDKPEQETLSSDSRDLPNEIWNMILQEVIKGLLPNIECKNLENFDQNFKNIWLTNEEFKEKLYKLKLVCKDFIYFIESDRFYGEIKKEIYQSVIDHKLIAAVTNNNEEMVKSLIEKGANVNVKNEFGSTALMLASKFGYKSIVEKLLQSNADVNFQDRYGNTALMDASLVRRHKEIVEILLKAGANVNARDNQGWSALILASLQGYKEIVQMLIKAGADVNVKDNDDNPALLLAAMEQSNKYIVEMLIKAGADVNAKDNDGYTALMTAARNDHKEVVEVLIKLGADINVKANDGNTALTIACLNDYEDIVDILREANKIL